MQIRRLYAPPKEINKELTQRIKDLMKKGGKIIDIIEDIIKFENMDVYDIIEQIPDSLVDKIKKELAERNHAIAKADCPEVYNAKLEDDVF